MSYEAGKADLVRRANEAEQRWADAETALRAAQELAEIYFSIGASVMGETEVRRLRDIIIANRAASRALVSK